MHHMQYSRISFQDENMEFLINRAAKESADPLTIVEVGHSRPKRGKRADAVTGSYQLHYVVSGTGLFRGQLLEEGTQYLVLPGEAQDMSVTSDGYEQYWIDFDGPDAERLLYSCGIPHRSQVVSRTLEDGRKQIIRRTFENVFSVRSDGQPLPLRHTHTYLVGVLYQILAANETGGSVPVTHGEKYAAEVCSFIHAHYMEKLTVGQLAALVKLSPKYLSRVFRRSTGCTPVQYLAKTRLEAACRLLLYTDKSVGQIASNAGYDDALYFSRAFRAAFGVSPREWRRRKEE